ncbi:MAG: hypothetical protein H6Q00_1249 [Holophagaceae bacterium]|nr:hypothetical protein [Holophagaceae bacterium]
MKLKGKTLCKLVKDEVLDEDLEGYKELLREPTHFCLKCGRACNDKKCLCKPEKL